ncbi:MAG: hypothetical protein FJ011_00715 [Chloroflexi bacterium]|nr:hypothetical protein [Chloroflexota bacterium]
MKHRLDLVLRIGLILWLAIGAWAGRHASADAPPTGATALFPSPNERFGYGVLYGIDNYNVAPLNAGWYQNWSLALNASHPAGALAAHVVRVLPEGLALDRATVQRIADADPGGLWIIGNEPDMFAQDNVTPTQYAAQYREAYFAIKAADPTAQVAAGGIVQPTPLRLGWLSATLAAYRQLYGGPLPADVWNIHNYVLQETPGQWGCGIPPGYYGARAATYPFNDHDSLTIFQEHVTAMRRWMADNGYRERPLIITEYGILFPESSGFDLTRVRNFFVNTANWMLTASDPNTGYPADDNHLVQRWMWYSLDDTNYNNAGNTIAGLMDPATRQMRPLGQAFADLATPLRRPYSNLVVARVQELPAATAATDGATESVRLRAMIQNRGNTAVAQAFRVLIEDGNGQLIHSQVVNGMPARYEGNALVEAIWQRPVGGQWRVRVIVDPDDAVKEANESDNRVFIEPRADLHLESLEVREGQTNAQNGGSPGSSRSLVATVRNLAGMSVAGAQVRFWDNAQLLAKATLGELSAGSQREVVIAWDAPAIGLHALVAEIALPAGVNDPIPDNNRFGRDLLIPGARSHLPAIGGPQFQSGQSVGVTCHNAVENGGFESGDLAPWTATQFVTLMNNGCMAGTYCLYMGRGWNIEDDVYQAMSIKPWATVNLSFAWAVVTTETDGRRHDTLTVELRSATGELLSTVQTLDNRDAHPYWYTSSFNLDSFAGQTLQLHFRANNDQSNTTAFFVDQINLEVCEKR